MSRPVCLGQGCANWPGISLSISGYEESLYLANFWGNQLKKITLYFNNTLSLLAMLAPQIGE